MTEREIERRNVMDCHDSVVNNLSRSDQLVRREGSAMNDLLRNVDDLNEDVDHREIQSKLSEMSFEDLQKLKAELGTKLYKEAYFGTEKVKQTSFKRLSKNRPREISSKFKPKHVIISPEKSKFRDPRFDSFCGNFDKRTFEKNYDFVNEMRAREKKELLNMLKEEKSEYKANKIRYLIQRMNNQERERLRREKEEVKLKKERQEHINALKSGKKPFYKSRYEKKVEKIVDKYKELKESGKLMKYIEKKQKKNNQKHKRYFQMENI